MSVHGGTKRTSDRGAQCLLSAAKRKNTARVELSVFGPADTRRCHYLAKTFPTGLTSGGPSEHPLSCNRNHPLRPQLLPWSCRQGWLHYVRHNVFTDLESHIPADAGREAIMEAG